MESVPLKDIAPANVSDTENESCNATPRPVEVSKSSDMERLSAIESTDALLRDSDMVIVSD